MSKQCTREELADLIMQLTAEELAEVMRRFAEIIKDGDAA